MKRSIQIPFIIYLFQIMNCNIKSFIPTNTYTTHSSHQQSIHTDHTDTFRIYPNEQYSIYPGNEIKMGNTLMASNYCIAENIYCYKQTPLN